MFSVEALDINCCSTAFAVVEFESSNMKAPSYPRRARGVILFAKAVLGPGLYLSFRLRSISLGSKFAASSAKLTS